MFLNFYLKSKIYDFSFIQKNRCHTSKFMSATQCKPWHRFLLDFQNICISPEAIHIYIYIYRNYTFGNIWENVAMVTLFHLSLFFSVIVALKTNSSIGFIQFFFANIYLWKKLKQLRLSTTSGLKSTCGVKNQAGLVIGDRGWVGVGHTPARGSSSRKSQASIHFLPLRVLPTA